jgi:hypothetical protein
MRGCVDVWMHWSKSVDEKRLPIYPSTHLPIYPSTPPKICPLPLNL